MGLLKCPDCNKLISDIFPMHDCVDKKKKRGTATAANKKSTRGKYSWSEDGWFNPQDDFIQTSDGYTMDVYRSKQERRQIYVRVTIEQIDQP